MKVSLYVLMRRASTRPIKQISHRLFDKPSARNLSRARRSRRITCLDLIYVMAEKNLVRSASALRSVKKKTLCCFVLNIVTITRKDTHINLSNGCLRWNGVLRFIAGASGLICGV